MLVTVRSVSRAHDAQPAHDGHRAGRRRLRPPERGVLQPAVAGAAAPARADTSPCSARPTRTAGSLQMTNPVVDLIGDRTGRIVPIYPQSEKAELHHVGDRPAGSRAPSSAAGPGASPTRCPSRSAVASASSTGSGRCSASTPRSRWPRRRTARRRLAFDELLRVQLVLVLRKRALERDATGIRHDIVGLAGGALPRSSCRSRSPAPSGARSPRSSPTSPARTRCTGCCRATSGRGKTVVAVSALLVAVQGGHQGAFMAPTEVLAEQHAASVRRPARRRDGAGTRAASSATGPLRVELLTNRVTGQERRDIARRPGRRHASTSPSARTRSSRRASTSPASAWS